MLEQCGITSSASSQSSIRLEPVESVRFDCVNGKWTIIRDALSVSFRLALGATCGILEEICHGGIFMDKFAHAQHSKEAGGTPVEQIGRLWRLGLFVKVIYYGSEKIAVLHNDGGADFLPEPPSPSDKIVMSEDTYLRTANGKLIVESVSCGAYVMIMNDRLAQISLPWISPMPCRQWAEDIALPEGITLAFVSFLESIGAMRRVDSTSQASEVVTEWSFADRLFFARSRLGRHTGGYGRKSLPRVHRTAGPVSSDNTRVKINLPCPVMSTIVKNDRPFTEILESRRSVREHGEKPLSLARLSEFLYRSARVTGQLDGTDEVTLRVYPSGGGLHELEIYPLIHLCGDLDSGLYRYDPFTHCLEEVSTPSEKTFQLLADARRSSRTAGEPQVLLLLAAKFACVNTKYESIAYSLILKNLGALFQTMYLVATAMGLAACALGGGNSDLFCRAAGTNFWQESTVGEFLLGEKAGTAC